MRGALVLAIALTPAFATTYDYVPFSGPNGVDIYPQAINNLGQIVGYYLDATGASHGFLRSTDGTLRTVDVPGAATTTLASISSTGWIVGSYATTCCQPNHGFRLAPDGKTFVTMAVNDGLTLATGVNSNGVVVGESGSLGFVTADSQTLTTFQLPTGMDVYPLNINDRNDVVGWVYVTYQSEAWLRIADGTTNLLNLGGGSQAIAINNSHQIVGTYPIPGVGPGAFLRNADGTMINLNGSRAVGINNNGQVIVTGPYALYNPDGTYVAVSLPGAATSTPIGLNDAGQVVGQYTVQGNGGATHTYGFLAAPMTGSPGPAIRTYHGVTGASGFGGLLTTAPGSWIEIYGVNLAGSTRPWQASDFAGNSAPISLDGVSVTINGQPAYVAYISPGQVNAVVPASVAAGPAMVTVTYGGSTSPPQTITVNATQPEMLMVNGCVAPVFTDGTLVSTSCLGRYPNIAQRGAHRGDTIVLYGIGFGPVAPTPPDGQIVTQLNQVQAPFGVNWQVAGSTSPVQGKVGYAGLAPGSLGLYQFNIVTPSVSISSIYYTYVTGTWTFGGITGTSFDVSLIQ